MKTLEQKKDERFQAIRKIARCIDSCTTEDHITSCKNLIRNHGELFKKDFPDYSRYDVEILTEELDKKLKKMN